MASNFPWQYRIASIFTDAIEASNVQRREPYWHENDQGVHSPDDNMVLRFRSYSDDGHAARQEGVLAVGTRTGQLLRGNDTLLDKAVHLTYSDVILHVADFVHMKTSSNHNLLWNGTPFNPRMNPYFQMPAALKTAQDAFAFAKGSVPGLDTIDSVSSLIPGTDLSSPFAVYTNLTPQKIPLVNKFAIEALRMLLPFANPTTSGVPTPHFVNPISPAFMPLGSLGPGIPPPYGASFVPIGTPLFYTPQFIALASLAQMDFDTMFETSVNAGQLGKEAKALMLSVVPGVGPILGAFA